MLDLAKSSKVLKHHGRPEYLARESHRSSTDHLGLGLGLVQHIHVVFQDPGPRVSYPPARIMFFSR